MDPRLPLPPRRSAAVPSLSMRYRSWRTAAGCTTSLGVGVAPAPPDTRPTSSLCVACGSGTGAGHTGKDNSQLNLAHIHKRHNWRWIMFKGSSLCQCSCWCDSASHGCSESSRGRMCTAGADPSVAAAALLVPHLRWCQGLGFEGQPRRMAAQVALRLQKHTQHLRAPAGKARRQDGGLTYRWLRTHATRALAALGGGGWWECAMS